MASKHGEYMRKWRRTAAGKATHGRQQHQHRQRHPERIQARTAVGHALRDGKLVRPTSCPSCGGTESRIEAHHHNGYEPEHWLDVVWVCGACHRKAHDDETAEKEDRGAD